MIPDILLLIRLLLSAAVTVIIIVILIQTAGPAIKESFQRSRKRRLASAKAE